MTKYNIVMCCYDKILYKHRNIQFIINLQYLFVHMLVYNKQFIIQYARYEHTRGAVKSLAQPTS